MDKAQTDEQIKQAYITSLRLLAASPKSGHELKKKLSEKGYTDGTIDETLARLRTQGILDDTMFAQDLMTRLIHGKAAGRHKVAFELKRHGVSQKLRNDLVGSLSDTEETERALDQARLKWAGWSNLDKRKRNKRLYDYLIRKGYDFQIAQDVLQKLSKESSDDDV